MVKRILVFLLIIHFIPLQSQEDSLQYHQRMEWFGDAKLGIFIHWGIYAVKGIDESWSFFNGYISHQDYLDQRDGFTAKNYDPVEWVRLFKHSGAKYAVITSRHHDGFSLWDTKLGSLNSVRHSAAMKDVLTPFIHALQEEDMKVGIYYSLPDWSHKDYPNRTRTEKRYQNDDRKWQNFLDYYQDQLKELQQAYKPDLWWFDGDWEFKADKWEAEKVKKQLLSANPKTIVNSRLAGYGDYATPEQGVPLHKPDADYWELCMTMNDSWGYQHNDKNYKTPYQIIRIFSDVIGMGGNLLLDVGPKADGSIPEEQLNILKELGDWTNKHQEAIFGSQAGLPPGYFYGPTTLSKDGQTLFLFLPHPPEGPVVLKGVKNEINRIRIVGDGTKLRHQELMKLYWSDKPGIVYIDVPPQVQDKYMTVIAVQLKGKLALEE